MTGKREPVDFLADGLRLRDRLSPRALFVWNDALYREIERRGGVEGGTIALAVAVDLLRELVERANRRLRDELQARLAGEISADDAERLDAELSDVLADVLAAIEVR